MTTDVDAAVAAPGDPLCRVDWPVRTDRLLLRRYRAEDADAVWAYRRLPEVGDWTWQYPTDREEFVARLESSVRSQLVVEANGVVVGDLKIAVEDGWAQREALDQVKGVQAELGWAFAPAAQGRGYATEAVRAALGICFDELGLRRVTGQAFAANTASVRVMEKVGMRCETRTVKETLHRDHGWLDGVGYAILAEEFRGN